MTALARALQQATPVPDPGLVMRPPTGAEFWLMLLVVAGVAGVFGLAWWQSRRDERR